MIKVGEKEVPWEDISKIGDILLLKTTETKSACCRLEASAQHAVIKTNLMLHFAQNAGTSYSVSCYFMIILASTTLASFSLFKLKAG